jgi:hypothetical protein
MCCAGEKVSSPILLFWNACLSQSFWSNFQRTIFKYFCASVTQNDLCCF